MTSLFLLFASCFAAQWEIDPSHSTVQFRVKHMMVTNVTGQIPDLGGQVTLKDDKDSTFTGEFWVDLNKIDTHNPDRDKHLKTADFFDVANHPKATFKIKKMVQKGTLYDIIGDLTMRGVTKEVAFSSEGLSQVQKAFGKLKRGFSATAKINRKDFKINWNKVLDVGVAVSDTVEIMVDVELERPADAKS